MFVGMNPGRSHEKDGRTLRGGKGSTAGAKLERMFESISWHPEKFYLTNLVKCSTKDDRLTNKDVQVVENCWQWSLREIEIKRPSCIVLLGKDVREHVSRKTEEPVPKWTCKEGLRATKVHFLPKPSFPVQVYGMPHPAAYLSRAERKCYMEALSSSEHFRGHCHAA